MHIYTVSILLKTELKIDFVLSLSLPCHFGHRCLCQGDQLHYSDYSVQMQKSL